MLGPRGWAGEGEACERGGVVGRGRGGESSLTLGTEKGGEAWRVNIDEQTKTIQHRDL